MKSIKILPENVANQMRGTSLVPLMKGRQGLSLDAYSETDYLAQAFKRSVRSADGWKFIYSLDTEKRELYDLNADPGETNNLIEKEPEIASKMEIQLFDHLNSLQAYD